jgi:hypothetical protein
MRTTKLGELTVSAPHAGDFRRRNPRFSGDGAARY